MIIDGFPDRVIIVNGEKYLYFGGTSYLGMATLPEFQNKLFENIKKWGTFYGSSRNANIKLTVFKEAEALFSKQIGAEASLTVSSGTLAGKLVVNCLSKHNKKFFHYPKTHPAILSDKSLPLFLNGKLHPDLLNSTVENVVITTDAILALEVLPTNFDFLNRISAKKKITLVVDESHSFGIVGKKGRGVFNTIKNKGVYRKIMVSSLGKALSLTGGVIASDIEFINLLKNEVDFISSSSANPAYLNTYLQTQDLYNKQREKLNQNLEFLFNKFDLTNQFKYNDNYPVIYCNESSVFKTLLKHKIVITNFKYPNYKKEMSRIVITANHSFEDLEKLIESIKKTSV